MHWTDDESLKKALSESADRKRWLDEGAAARFTEIAPLLPPELKSKDRLGALSFEEIRGTEGRACWMLPLDGSNSFGKILGLNHQVKLLDRNGSVIFEGRWGDTPRELVEKRVEFFVWLALPERKLK